MMKKVLVGIGIFVALIVAVMLGSWFGTQGARSQAGRMIEMVKANDVEALESVMSPALIEVATPAKLMHMARTWGLHESTDVSWSKWSISTEGANVSGAFTRADGVEQPLYLRFNRHDGEWKLSGFTTDSVARVSDPLALEIPESTEIAAMLAQVTRDFGEGVRARSFVKLHESMSFGARSRFSPAELEANFSQFVERQVDVSPVANLTPLLHAPAGIDTDGVLRVEGHYPSRPIQFNFDYSFSFEDGQWRLSGLKVSTTEPEAGPATTEN
jgi:hypothetical protein